MLASKTVFVIGAGVSAEFGMPLGGGLAKNIAAAVAPDSQSYAINRWCSPGDPRAVGRRVRDALSVAASIDNAVEHHRDDEAFVQMAKVGIAHEILAAEHASTLYDGRDRQIVSGTASDSTFGVIFRLLVAGLGRGAVAKIFDDVSFINFNYDRCLERFMTAAIVSYSGCEPHEAGEIVRRARLLHPYGSLGDLSGPAALPFGFSTNDAALGIAADRLRTFTEGVGSNEVAAIREEMSQAETLVFLGCAHHPQNFDLIRPKIFKAKNVYGTAYLAPPADPAGYSNPAFADFCKPACDALAYTVRHWPRTHSNDIPYMAIEPLTAHQLVARYGPSWVRS